MNIWNMTKKDLQVFFRDRAALVWLFVLPLVFIVIFAGLTASSNNDSAQGEEQEAAQDERTPLAVVNQDLGGAIAARLIADLDQAGGYRVVQYELEQAEGLLSKLKLARYLVIPPDFSAGLEAGRPVSLRLITHPNVSNQSNQAVMQVIGGVTNDLSLELQLLDGIEQMGAMQGATGQEVFPPERILAQAKSQFERSRHTPLVAVVQRLPREEVEAEDSGFDLSKSIVPGMAVLFVFLAAQTVARNIFEERQNGSLLRLLAAPVPRWELLAGKLAPILLLTLIQIAFIFALGALLLPLLGIGRLGIGESPLAWAVTSFVMALCSTCLGILIAALARTESQVSGLSNALLWVAGFLGGALVPSFLIQSIPPLNVLSRFVPQTWANQAYYDILARGKGLVDVLPALGILLIFSAVFFIIGVRKFRFQ